MAASATNLTAAQLFVRARARADSQTLGDHLRTHATDKHVHVPLFYRSIVGKTQGFVVLCSSCSTRVRASTIVRAVRCDPSNLRMLQLPEGAETSEELVIYTAVVVDSCRVLAKLHESEELGAMTTKMIEDRTFKAHVASSCLCIQTVVFFVPNEVHVLLDADSPPAYTRADCEKTAMHAAEGELFGVAAADAPADSPPSPIPM